MKLNPLGSNMTEVELGNGITVLFSYKTPVAYHKSGVGYFKTDCRWSSTTTRHINKWLDGCAATVVPQAEIDLLVQ